MGKTLQPKKAWIQTFSGLQFYPLAPRIEDINIVDIAHGLSLLCRFGGQCTTFYSVAQHSVYVSDLLPKHLKLAGLLHDATEAYLIDLPRPIKLCLKQYITFETRLAEVVSEKFNVSFDDPRLHRADNAVLMAEAKVLFKSHPAPWSVTEPPADIKIVPISPRRAEFNFLEAYKRLTYGAR